MAKQTREQLGVKAGDKIILKGTVAFARVDKAVSGDALVRENERRAKLGMMKTKEFRSIVIENPEIVQGEGTPLAQFHAQSIYPSKATGKPTISFESKSLFPPAYGHMQEDGSVKEIPDPQKNPNQGQVVYLMVSAFKPKGFNNLGSTFDAIVFAPGPIDFYEGKANSLAGFGEAMNMPVEKLSANDQPSQEVVQKEVVGAGVGAADGQQAGFGGQQAGFGGQQTGFGGFGAAPTGEQAQPNQGGFGGFGGFGATTAPQGSPVANPFGLQGEQVANQGSPFGNGQRTTSPYA